MKVGIDIRLIGKKRTGDEVVFFNLVKNLAKIDNENKYVLFTDITDQETLEEIGQQLGIAGKDNFKIVALQTPNRFAWNFWTLPLYLRKNPVDIYHTQYITPWFVPRKIKIVTIIHDISFNFFPQFIKKSDLIFLKTLIPMSLARADKIIAVSEFTKKEIIDYYHIDPKKIECIYNAIADDFSNGVEITEEEKRVVRKKYNLPEKFILYVGTLQPRKNIGHLIEAFARITGKLDGTKLVIGGNKKAHNFDTRIDEGVAKYHLEQEVIFPGFVDEQDKKAVFALAQAFVFPSLYEGFGIPVLEAMSQKVPVVCSDIPSLKEIADGGARYFNVESLDDFENTLYTATMDQEIRRELTAKGLERVSFFSWEKSARLTLALYDKMVHNG